MSACGGGGHSVSTSQVTRRRRREKPIKFKVRASTAADYAKEIDVIFILTVCPATNPIRRERDGDEVARVQLVSTIIYKSKQLKHNSCLLNSYYVWTCLHAIAATVLLSSVHHICCFAP